MRLLAAAICVFLPLLAGPALAESGVALGVDPDASAVSGGDVRRLVVGADVAIGETVRTGPTGLVQLLFNDETELVVGPGSSLVIEDYLLRDDGSPGRFAINALAGTFRFVSGGAPKNSYDITTPTGTIGVRGTGFDFTIGSLVLPQIFEARIATSVLLYAGVVELCNLARQCVVLDNRCDVGVSSIAATQTVDSTLESRRVFRTLFPYAASQNDLLARFRINGVLSCIVVAPQGADPVTGVDNPQLQLPRRRTFN